ncbi:MAG TPA: hypothetical protein PLV53_09470 [Anaerolineaceae bacterium]|nr:hypothetical protein [Anaerolineaceae bacterium]
MTQPRDYEDDDGRVIVNMDVEGMRWHDRRSSSGSNRPDFPIVRRGGLRGDELTESETRRYTFYALLAGLVVVLVFAATWVLLVLFMTQVWFR